MPGVSGVTVVTNARAYYHYTRGCGRIGARHSLRPLIFRWRNRLAKLGRIVPRDRGSVSFQLFENRIGNGARALHPRRPGEGQDPYAVARV